MKIHVGCGEKYLPGFKHIDARNFEHVDYVTDDLSNLSMFDDNTIDEIYACHLLEHFTREEISNGEILTEWYRVLKSGGILRIAVPNFSISIKYIIIFHISYRYYKNKIFFYKKYIFLL